MSQSVWATPRITPPPQPPQPPPPPIVAPVAIRVPIRGGTTLIPYYNPGRIFKDIKVVADLRQSGTERGEVQTGDDGHLGPGSIAPPQTSLPTVTPVVEKPNYVPLALAVAAFFILGG